MWSDLVQRFVNMAIKGMVNLGAEFVHINEYHSTMFAENARQFDEFAEGMTFILSQPFHAQEQCD